LLFLNGLTSHKMQPSNRQNCSNLTGYINWENETWSLQS